MKGVKVMDLAKVSTAELVEELAKREAVEAIRVAPYEKYAKRTEKRPRMKARS